ncbi:MAG: hypothetical protein AAF569_02265 [Pseudomonadota bacterium]
MTRQRHKESGNVFVFILLGVILFGALIYTFTSSGQQGISSLTKKEAELAANEMLNYARIVEQTVNRLRAGGCAESQISFNNSVVSGYSNPNSPVDGSCEVFNQNGGGLTWQTPSETWLDSQYSAETEYGEWNFSHKNCVGNLGAVPCAQDTPSAVDLLIQLPLIKSEICESINKKVGGPIPLVDATAAHRYELADGDYTEPSTTTIIAAGISGKTTACFGADNAAPIPDGAPTFYHVLIIR